jgi:hypothetical protein
MCKLSVVNKAGDVVAEGVTPETFAGFKKKQGKGSAVVVELLCGEEIFVDTVKLLRRLPKDSAYKARLLRRVEKTPESLGSAGHDVWVEA